MMKVRKNISDHIYDVIKSDILEGKLEFGDKIVEIDYSKKLDVSRTPLREAIKKLEIEGVIERLPNGRLKIMEMNEKKIEEIFQIRIALEGLLFNSFKKDEDAFIAIEENLSLTELHLKAENWGSARKLFSEYNELFYEMSDLELTVKVLKNYDFIISKLRMNSLKSSKRMKNALKEHSDILKYIANKDIKKAKELNEIHLTNSKNSILESFKKKNDQLN